MPVKPVLKMGNPLLNVISAPVEEKEFGTPELKGIIEDMLDTMRATNGAGIAAIQIGVPKRIFMFEITKNPRYPDAAPIPLTVLVNPEVTVLDSDGCEYMEGCLSVPGLRGPVNRPKAVSYTAVTEEGKSLSSDGAVDGFHARVVQHELDHLDGRLFPSRVTDFTRFGFTEELEGHSVIEKPKE